MVYVMCGLVFGLEFAKGRLGVPERRKEDKG